MAKIGKPARRAASVDATQMIRIDGGRSTEIGADQRLAVGRALTISVGGDATLDIGAGITLSATKVKLRALQELRLEVGSSQLVLKPNGDIQIKGNRIEIFGSGEVHLKGANVHSN